MEHIFLINCSFSKCIWKYIDELFGAKIDVSSDIEKLLQTAFKMKTGTQIFTIWIAFIISSLWLIWKIRNEAIFKGKAPSNQRALICIHNCIQEANDLENSCMKNSISDLLILHRFGIKGRAVQAPSIVEVQWKPPEPGWIKINTDGSTNGSPGMAGCGGIFQTYRGFCIGCFAHPIVIALAFEAELMGIISAIEYAKLYSWDKLWFESNFTYIVDLLQKKSITVPCKYKSKWLNALSFLATITYKATHIFWKGNAVADKLASHGTHLNTTQWWFCLPDFCSNEFNCNLTGFPNYHFIMRVLEGCRPNRNVLAYLLMPLAIIH